MEIAVVGGGVAGLTAGALLAQQGARVTVFEAAGELGGRARTTVRDGYFFNLGAHALYQGGAGARVRQRLGVEVTGGRPALRAFAVTSRGRLHPAFRGSRGGPSLRDRAEATRVLAVAARQDPAALSGSSAASWLDDHVRSAGARSIVEAGFRVTTYSAEYDQLSAGAAVAQLGVALRGGVRYLDGGWSALVEALRARAVGAGAEVVTGERVVRVQHDDRVRGVRLASGRELPVDGVVLAAGGPGDAAKLVDGPAAEALAAYDAARVPVRAACLDLALSRLSDPSPPYVLGLDEPIYLSVHSCYGALAPAGGALVHTLWYLREEDSPQAARLRLEALLDLVLPGWRAAVVHEQFLPRLEVAGALPTAATGGLGGRPQPHMPGVEGLYLAGDWVGAEGLLADASFASAERAADLLLATLRDRAKVTS